VSFIGFAVVMAAFITGKTYGHHAAMWSGYGNGIIEEAAWGFSANRIYRDFDQCMALATDAVNKHHCYCAKMVAKTGDGALFHTKLTSIIECARAAVKNYNDDTAVNACRAGTYDRWKVDQCKTDDDKKKADKYTACLNVCPGWNTGR